MGYSAASSIQQSVMNFGILMIQGLVNSFGTAVMAAFAAAVKIDSFAYMPAQEFANAFSIFISQNRGAGKEKRVQKGVRSAVTVSAAFCICVSVLIYFGARYLMRRDTISAYRRSILLWNRYSVLVVWVLQSGRKTGDVGGADGDLAWNESAAFLYTGTDKVDWSDCNLVVNSDWMVPGRRDRICLFAIYE